VTPVTFRLIHELYRGVRLTVKGEKIAMPALRRHRLVEVFLVKVMKYGWDEAHELSDQFALGVNDIVEDRIDELTGHPKRCPHGEPIRSPGRSRHHGPAANRSNSMSGSLPTPSSHKGCTCADAPM